MVRKVLRIQKFALSSENFYNIEIWGGSMYSIRQILKENWVQYLEKHTTTYHQKKEIQKMIDCSKNSCNSRICSSCGKRYADTWSQNLKDNLHPAPCRHVVLTVPSLLIPILRNWNNLNILLRSSRDFFKNFNQTNPWKQGLLQFFILLAKIWNSIRIYTS